MIELTDDEIRRMRVWEQRVLRPTARRESTESLLGWLEKEEAAFTRALDGVPESAFRIPVSEERMSPARIALHLAVTTNWQAAMMRACATGDPQPRIRMEDLFSSPGHDGRESIREELKVSVRGLREAASLCAGKESDEATHPIFGPLNPREWIMSAIGHFEYHRAQLVSVTVDGD